MYDIEAVRCGCRTDTADTHLGMDMMGEPVEQRPGQTLRAESLGLFVEGKYPSEDCGALVVLRHEFGQLVRLELR